MNYLKAKLIKVSQLLLFLLSGSIIVKADVSDLDMFARDIRPVVADFSASLIRICEIEIETIGLHAATEVCRITAPQLYYEYSIKNNIILNLVSLTPRNVVTGHADAWEQAGLLKMQELINKGVKASDIEIIELVEEPAETYYRYMSPMIVTSFCLKCHGKQNVIDTNAANSIDFLYPADKAKGYKIGDLIGAISIKKAYAPPAIK